MIISLFNLLRSLLLILIIYFLAYASSLQLISRALRLIWIWISQVIHAQLKTYANILLPSILLSVILDLIVILLFLSFPKQIKNSLVPRWQLVSRIWQLSNIILVLLPKQNVWSLHQRCIDWLQTISDKIRVIKWFRKHLNEVLTLVISCSFMRLGSVIY